MSLFGDVSVSHRLGDKSVMRESQQIVLKDNGEREQNRYALFTVPDAENAMLAFTIFAIAVIFGIFLYELLITRSGIIKSLGVVLGNVSSVLSAATLLTILLEGFDIMFFRRTRGERAKLKKERAELKEERRELEDLKKEVGDLKDGSQVSHTVAQSGKAYKPDTKPTKTPSKPEKGRIEEVEKIFHTMQEKTEKYQKYFDALARLPQESSPKRAYAQYGNSSVPPGEPENA